jgi:DNA-binding NarL/FixJ family response regulator
MGQPNKKELVSALADLRTITDRETAAGRPMMKVMVVEDSAVVRDIMRLFLAEIPGLAVVGEFCCAPTAIAGTRRDPPDVLLLDIQLYTGSGMDVLKTVLAEHRHTKVLVVSNFADPVFRKRYIEAGAYAFFDKSRELHLLRSSLKELAGHGQP